MYLDFENLDLTCLEKKFSEDIYFSSILEFLRSFIETDSFVSYTSGSTAPPKSLVIDKCRALESARLSNDFFGVTNNTHFIHCLDNKYIGSKMMLVRAYIAKAKVEIVKPSLDFYNSCNSSKIDFISLTPPHIYRILEFKPNFFEQVKICLIGASGVSLHLEKSINTLPFDTKFYESFAMTETISHFALRNISANQTEFQTLKGFEISVNEHQCLEVYHKTILPEKIVTNDIVDINDNGSFNFRGRFDNLINSGGLKINPEELEKQWSLFLPFKFILTGEPNQVYDQRIVMVVSQENMLSKSEIISILNLNNIPSRLRPKEFFYSSTWEETPSRKPLRDLIVKNKVLLP